MPRARTVKYENRTDLNQPSTEPVTAVPNQEYGKAGAQRQAQMAVPIGTPSTPPPATPASLVQHQMQPLPAPGTQPFLEPTNRPDEPVTAGVPFGPGPSAPPAAPAPVLSGHIMNAALQGGSDALANIALGLHSVGM